MAFNLETFQDHTYGGGDAPHSYNYKTDDASALVVADGYFDEMTSTFNLGDHIYFHSSTGVGQLVVTSERNVVPVTMEAFGFVGTIGTGDIPDASVHAVSLNADVAGSGLDSTNGLLSVDYNPTELSIIGDIVHVADLGVGADALVISVPRTETFPMTAADFHSMFITPFELLAAPGANKLYIVQSVAYAFNYIDSQYFSGGGDVAVQYDSTADGLGVHATAVVTAAVFQGYTQDSTVGARGLLPASLSSLTVNKGLFLSNQGSSFINGNGTLEVSVTYSTVTTAV